MNHQASGKVASLNQSPREGESKKPINQCVIKKNGIPDDAHNREKNYPVSMLSLENIEFLGKKYKKKFTPGELGENITTRGIDTAPIRLLDRFVIGEAELEVTRRGKKLQVPGKMPHQGILPDEGLYLRVITPGNIKNGDDIFHFPRSLSFKVITLIDNRETREDKYTQIIAQHLKKLFRDQKIRVDRAFIPNTKEELRDELESLLNAAYDVIFTISGTDINPGEMLVDTVADLCDDLIPQTMDKILQNLARDNQEALLSRWVAGIYKNTLIYALPGSSGGIEAYMNELLKYLEHDLYTLHNID